MSKLSKTAEHQDLLKAFAPFESFSKAMLDAYVIIDTHGQILKCNQLFSTLTSTKAKKILQAGDLDQVLRMTIGGTKLDSSVLLNKKTPTRIDEVRGETATCSDLNLILGIYPFLVKQKVIGAFLLIRDVTAETKLQDKYTVKATQSITDKLTGLYNRTYLEHYLEKVLHQEGDQSTESADTSFLMADIDHFKAVNDNYGHQAGDLVIETVATIFRHNFRKTDVLCRYGGEEFLAILPSTDHQGALKAAEKFREAVEQHMFCLQDLEMAVTISIGLTQHASTAEAPSIAIARADTALYQAKKDGRNRICVIEASTAAS